MKKILLFELSFTNNVHPSRKLVFKKEVAEIIPIGAHYLPFGNELRTGIITGPYIINEATNELTMQAVFKIPFEKYGLEEGRYVRENMYKYGWSTLIDTIDDLN